MAHADEGKPFGVCDPNSGHQTWARWVFDARAITAAWMSPDFDQIKLNVARFFRSLTRGSSAAMELTQIASATSPGQLRYTVTLWWDQRQVLDEAFVEHVRLTFERFLVGGLGNTVTVTVRPPKRLAGDFEDGLKPAQWLHMAPRIEEGRIFAP